MNELVKVLVSGVGTTGVAMIFKIRKKYILLVAIGGVLVSGIYANIYNAFDNLFLASIVGAIFAGIWSEIMARIMKAPANIFLIPGIIPLLPGGNLFYTMYWLIQGNHDQFVLYRNNTIQITFGVVAGTLIASVVFVYLWTIVIKLRR